MSTTGSELVGILGSVRVDTQAVADPPPVEEVGLNVEVTGKALGVVGETVLVENPVRIVALFPWHEVGTQACASAILVEVNLHVVEWVPVVNRVHCTTTGVAVELCAGEGLHGASLAVGYVGTKGEDFIFLLAVEAEGCLLVACGWDDTILIIERATQEEATVLVTTADAQVSVPSATVLKEVANVVVGWVVGWCAP